MADGPARRYWDSSVFIALIKDEEGRAPTVETVLEAAERGETEIVTCAFTLVEVVKTPDAQMPLTKSDEALIRNYLEHEYIVVVPFGRDMAAEARRMIWRHGLHVGDAIHAACALRSDVQVLETYDGRFDRLSGHPAVGPLTVREPKWEGDFELDLEQPD